MLKLFHKEVKGHGQGHMFKIHGTIEKEGIVTRNTWQIWTPYILQLKKSYDEY